MKRSHKILIGVIIGILIWKPLVIIAVCAVIYLAYIED